MFSIQHIANIYKGICIKLMRKLPKMRIKLDTGKELKEELESRERELREELKEDLMRTKLR